MKKKKTDFRQIFNSLIMILAGAAIIYFLYPVTHPMMGLKIKTPADSIKIKAVEIADQLGLNTEGYLVITRMKLNRDLIKQSQLEKGIAESNKFLSGPLPGFLWNVKWQPIEGQKIFFGNEDPDQIAKALLGEFSLDLDMSGNLLRLSYEIPDSVQLPALEESEAVKLAERFIYENLPYDDLDYTTDPQNNSEVKNKSILFEIGSDGAKIEELKKEEDKSRTDYTFNYKTKDDVLGNDININVSVTGNLISNLKISHDVPEIYETSRSTGVTAFFSAAVFIIIVVILIIIAFKKFRAYELGFKNAFPVALITSLALALGIYLQITEQYTWELLIPIFIGPLFLGGMMLLLWAVSESIGREVWKEKFIGFDLISNGHLLHSYLGYNFLRSAGFAFLIYALWLVFLLIVEQSQNIYFYAFKNDEVYNTPFLMGLVDLFDNVSGAFTKTAFLFISFISLLRKKINSTFLLVIVSAVIIGIAWQGPIGPWYYGIPIQIILGAILSYIFLKTDILTIVLIFIIYLSTKFGAYFTIADGTGTQDAAVLMSSIFLGFIIFSFIAIFTKDSVEDYESITPAFAKNISERQRMQRELEIARQVQMSFLPKKVPSIEGIEIASKCIPANEVGGDYYDFVRIDENKLGVVIGDVSGKGTQAAFYMTLTKGFMRALSATNNSPAQVLSKMNNLFYENVDRGTFISMIYSIIDLEERKITLARAGHNPLFFKGNLSQDVQKYNPAGLALGLEKGVLFSKTIQEESIPIEKGDILVFYTDGFTEAMDKKNAEYGEKRFAEIINNNSDKSAGELMDIIFADVNKFIGKAPQHDDMTIVVVKVL